MKVAKQENKYKARSLFIIFGTSKGLGQALYKYCIQFKQNDLLIINRRPTRPNHKNTKEIIIDLSTVITSTQLSRLFNQIHFSKKHKNIYLINNASIIYPIKPIGKADNQELINNIYINFLNYTIIINQFVKSTVNIEANKKILNITSGAASSPHYGLSAYCATKAALEMFGRSVFIEQQYLKQVKILNFRPGVINTSMQKTMRNTTVNNFQKVDSYKKLFKEKKLLKPGYVAHKIYQVLLDDRYWKSDILDISQVPLKSKIKNKK